LFSNKIILPKKKISKNKDYEIFTKLKNNQMNLDPCFCQEDLLDFVKNCILFGDDYNILFAGIKNNKSKKDIKNVTKIGKILA
jgi:hypothetical protein